MLPGNLDRGLLYLALYLGMIGAVLFLFNPELPLLVMPMVLIPTSVVAAVSYRRNPEGGW